jgi:hypothetical protein
VSKMRRVGDETSLGVSSSRRRIGSEARGRMRVWGGVLAEKAAAVSGCLLPETLLY